MMFWPNKHDKAEKEKKERIAKANRDVLLKPRKPSSYKKRAFESAQQTRVNNWKSLPGSMDDELKHDLKTMRGLSRDLSQNNQYVRRWLSLVQDNVVGERGFTLSCQFRDEKGKLKTELNHKIEKEWIAFTRKPEVTGKYSWVELQKLVMTAVARDGEALVRCVIGTDHNKFKFTLQMVDIECLDEGLNEENDDGSGIAMGVGHDEFGTPTHYYLRTKANKNVFKHNGVNYLKIPANQIIHIFKSDILSSRGYPLCHSIIKNLRALHSYINSEVISAKVSSSKMGFFTRLKDTDVPETQFRGEEEGEDQEDYGNYITEAEPGSFEVLPQGVDFKAFNPDHPSVAFKDFVGTMLKGIASGLNISYSSLSNSLEANYSSLRQEMIEQRNHWISLQQFMIDGFLLKVYQKWLNAAILSKNINLKIGEIDHFYYPNFSGKRWPWVDPKRDTDSALASLAAGVRSRTDICRESGKDVENVFLEIKREDELIKSLGINITHEKLVKHMKDSIEDDLNEDENAK